MCWFGSMKKAVSLRITQPIHVNVSRLLRTLSTIKYYVPEWPRVVHECFLSNDDGPAVLAALAKAIINGNTDVEIYKLTRLITTLMNKLIKMLWRR